MFVLGLFVGVLVADAFFRYVVSKPKEVKAEKETLVNVEEWSAVRDRRGRLVKIVVHRRQET